MKNRKFIAVCSLLVFMFLLLFIFIKINFTKKEIAPIIQVNQKQEEDSSDNMKFEEIEDIEFKKFKKYEVDKDAEVIYFRKNNEDYTVNLITKNVSPRKSERATVLKFVGLPTEEITETFERGMSRFLYSKDKSQVFILFKTFDRTKSRSEYDGSYPLIKEEEFLCSVQKKECIPSQLFSNAKKSVNGMVFWDAWDSSENLLFGHLAGDGVGNAAPIFIFNYKTQKLEKTNGYNSIYNSGEKRAEVPKGFLSPSFQKSIMIDENFHENKKWELLLYDNNNLSEPEKRIDISTMKDDSSFGGRIGAVDWTNDEKGLVLLVKKQIFILDLDTGKISLRYTDTTRNSGGSWLDFNNISFSPSGRFIAFVDYDSESIPGYLGTNTFLMVIDLEDNSEKEIFREKGLRLSDTQFEVSL